MDSPLARPSGRQSVIIAWGIAGSQFYSRGQALADAPQLASPIRMAIAVVATIEILSREMPRMEELRESLLIDLCGIGSP